MLIGRSADLPFVQLPGRRSADPFAGGPPEVSVRIVHLQSDGLRRPHRHPRSCEVVHVVAGTGEAWQDGIRATIGPGDSFYVPAGVPHATLPRPGSTLELVCFFPHGDLAANLEELTAPALAWEGTAPDPPASPRG